MKVPDRVQIVPLGYEKSRVLKPIHELKADRVVLLRQAEAEDYEAEFQRELIEELEANERIQLDIRRCDIFDIDASLEQIKRAIIECDDEDEVFVNIATGTKLTAIAGVLACQTTGATPFYVEPEFRGAEGHREPPAEPIVETAGDIIDIKVFPLQLPPTEQLEVLAYLDSHGDTTLKELIEFSEEQNHSYITDTTSKSDEGKYRLLRTHIIQPLRDEDYITLEKSGREKRVQLTERGRDLLKLAPV